MNPKSKFWLSGLILLALVFLPVTTKAQTATTDQLAAALNGLVISLQGELTAEQLEHHLVYNSTAVLLSFSRQIVEGRVTREGLSEIGTALVIMANEIAGIQSRQAAVSQVIGAAKRPARYNP